jgi:hypothetical protein
LNNNSGAKPHRENGRTRHCEERQRRSNPGAACIERWIASLRSQ